MSAGVANFTLEQGATWTKTLTWQDANGSAINLTGYTARMKVRQSPRATGTPLLDLASTGGSPAIVLGGALGTIVITVSATATAALDWTNPAYYDLELEDGSGVVYRLIEGTMTLNPEVTRTDT